MVHIPNFINIYTGIKMLLRGHKDGYHDDLNSLKIR
jgi:hypothetical protein